MEKYLENVYAWYEQRVSREDSHEVEKEANTAKYQRPIGTCQCAFLLGNSSVGKALFYIVVDNLKQDE